MGGLISNIYFIILIIGIIPHTLLVYSALDHLEYQYYYDLFNSTTIKQFLTCSFILPVFIKNFLSDRVNRTGIIIVEILYNLFFWPYTVIILGIVIIGNLIHLVINIFLKVFGKESE